MDRHRVLVVLFAVAASACDSSSASPNPGGTETKSAASCGAGDHKVDALGFCVKLPPGAQAGEVLDNGPGSKRVGFSAGGKGIDVETRKSSLEAELEMLTTISKSPGNKELERKDLPGKGKYVITEEDACKCTRITAVAPRDKGGVVWCMTYADLGKSNPEHFEICKSLRVF